MNILTILIRITDINIHIGGLILTVFFFRNIHIKKFSSYLCYKKKINIYLFRNYPKWNIDKMILEKIKYYTGNQEKLARYSKALANPVRVFIMDYLTNNLHKCCYSGDMAEELPIARSTLSEHLKELKNAGLIQGEINPPYIKYCINRENWEEAKKIFNNFFNR
jgi:ArsR family transcriptional regulator, arsenate/arsenite/antimonite-responsive transcriptional repressor